MEAKWRFCLLRRGMLNNHTYLAGVDSALNTAHAAVQVNPVQVGLGQVGLGQIGPFFWPVNALSDRDLTGLTGQGRG